MIDIILTILGVGLYIPFLVQLFRTHWDKTMWPRQLLLLFMALELTTLLHVPSVMFCGAGVFLAALIIYIIVIRPKFRLTPFLIIGGLYVISFAVSILWSAIPEKGWLYLLNNGLPILGFAGLASVVELTKEEIFQCLKVFCYAALIFVGLAFLSLGISCYEQSFNPLEWPFASKSRLALLAPYQWVFRFNGGINGYFHPSYNLLPLFAAICAAMRLGKERILHPSIGWILLFCGSVITLLTQSRMSIIYCSLILVAATIYIIPTFRKRLISAGIIIIAGVGIFVSTQTFWRNIADDPVRDMLHEETWRYIKAKPWTGSGAGALNPIEICRTTGDRWWPNIGWIDVQQDVRSWPWKTRMLPHNQWLADWAHAGIFAAICALLLYLSVATECIQKRSYWGGVLMLILIIFSFLEPTLYIGKGLYLFCLFACLIETYNESTVSITH